jgi:hypothetical protein
MQTALSYLEGEAAPYVSNSDDIGCFHSVCRQWTAGFNLIDASWHSCTWQVSRCEVPTSRKLDVRSKLMMHTGTESRRLAVVDLDWDHVRAVDIHAALRSFLPANGRIASVTVYPSDYGLQRMQEEAAHGPQVCSPGAQATCHASSDCMPLEIIAMHIITILRNSQGCSTWLLVDRASTICWRMGTAIWRSRVALGAVPNPTATSPVARTRQTVRMEPRMEGVTSPRARQTRCAVDCTF